MKYYITTAIDYPSGKPHLGHAYEKIITDVLARWNKFLGKDVRFLTGTDEHGQKIQKCAEVQGQTPKEYVDDMVDYFKELCEAYNISYDRFIRTTDEDHEKLAREVIQKVFDKGDIYKDKYEGWYCVDCETFYTDKELNEANCPQHQRKCTWFEEESYFFKLSKYADQVLKYIEEQNYIFPKTRQNHIVVRIKEGVKDISISRTNFNWGIKVPFDNKHKIYVWFDALLNYISGAEDKWPADVHVIGHDILWHHSVIWLSILLAADYKLPKKLLVHGFINDIEGKKMSKSLGNIIDPMQLVEDYPLDTLRYYMIREFPLGQDANFSIECLKKRHNSELANDLGNLLNRVLVMYQKYFDGKITKEETDEKLFDELNIKKINKCVEDFDLHCALSEIWKFINCSNKYINDKEPWTIKDKNELSKVMYNLADALRILASLLHSFIPDTSEKIMQQLGTKLSSFDECKPGLLEDTKIKKGELLFKKLED